MELITCSQEQKDSIAAFDTLCTSPKIQLLKIMISFVSPPMQGMLAFYIKFMELNYTIQLFRTHREVRFGSSAVDVNRICEEMDPYLAPEERSKLKSMKEMYQNFESMKDMMDMVNSMKEMFPEGFDMSNMGDMAGMGGMNGMENIFEMMNQFGGMNGTDKQTGVDE